MNKLFLGLLILSVSSLTQAIKLEIVNGTDFDLNVFAGDSKVLDKKQSQSKTKWYLGDPILAGKSKIFDVELPYKDSNNDITAYLFINGKRSYTMSEYQNRLKNRDQILFYDTGRYGRADAADLVKDIYKNSAKITIVNGSNGFEIE